MVWLYPVGAPLRSFLSALRFARPAPLSSMDSPRASNADPFSCLLAFRVSRLFSFMVARWRMNGGLEQGLGVNRPRATVLHWCNVSTSSCPHALQGRSIPTTNDGVGIFFVCIPLRWQRVQEPARGANRSNATHRRGPRDHADDARDRISDRSEETSHRLISPKTIFRRPGSGRHGIVRARRRRGLHATTRGIFCGETSNQQNTPKE
ncbi:hypothetical protein BLA6993_03574 [Burkholderia lata]|nr:hypothetical protein BLA6993_03574 [Burkholderia lata]